MAKRMTYGSFMCRGGYGSGLILSSVFVAVGNYFGATWQIALGLLISGVLVLVEAGWRRRRAIKRGVQ